MIVAYRIPILTERMRAATVQAAAAQGRPAPPAGDRGTPRAGSPARRLVRRLESLGYTVELKRRVA